MSKYQIILVFSQDDVYVLIICLWDNQ